jgi:hypothetical protein
MHTGITFRKNSPHTSTSLYGKKQKTAAEISAMDRGKNGKLIFSLSF